MEGLAKWARDAIKDIERIAKALERWSERIEEDRAERQRQIGAERAAAARAAVESRRHASAPAAPRAGVASQPPKAPAPAGQRPASQAPQSPPAAAHRSTVAPAGEVERLRRDVERAIAGQGVKKSDALTRAAAAGDRESVDRLLDNGAAVLPKSIDAAAKSGRDDVFKKLVGFEGSATDAVSLRELAAKCSSPEARQKLERLAAQAKAQGGHVGGLGIDGPKGPGAGGPKAGAGMAGPK